MNLPDKKNCFALMNRMGMPEHIIAHSLQVGRVALLLADHLGRAGHALNSDLLLAAAMLHDITKPRSFQTGENHAQTGAELLAVEGFAEVAALVGQHVRLDRYPVAPPPDEAAVINYADKRVLHDEVVSLDRRMAYIFERYGGSDENCRRIRMLWRMSTELEAVIFDGLLIGPADLIPLLADGGPDADLAAFRHLAATSAADLDGAG